MVTTTPDRMRLKTLLLSLSGKCFSLLPNNSFSPAESVLSAYRKSTGPVIISKSEFMIADSIQPAATCRSAVVSNYEAASVAGT